MGRTRGGAKKMQSWIKLQTRKNFPAYQRRVHQKMHIQLADGLILDTPVGNPDLWQNPPPPNYVGGRARGAWQSSVGRPAAGETGRIDPNGRATLSASQSILPRIGAYMASYITNNVPYIRRLNDSPQWSRQQTPGWVQRNIQRVKRQFK